MIMEAMRLSLIDHEEQQKKQKEEEEKNKNKDAEAPASQTTESAGSSSRDVLDTTTFLQSPSSPSQSASGTTSAHRSSSSLSRVSIDPSSNTRRSPSPRPMSALETALRSATSAASAVVSSSTSYEEPATSNTSPAPPIPQIVHTDASVDEALTETSTGPAATPSTSEQTTTTPDSAPSSSNQLAAPQAVHRNNARSMSFSSSVLSEETQNGEVYDYLPSSPSSSTSSLVHKANLSPDLHRTDESEGQGSVNA
jgi:hypothetical protein